MGYEDSAAKKVSSQQPGPGGSDSQHRDTRDVGEEEVDQAAQVEASTLTDLRKRSAKPKKWLSAFSKLAGLSRRMLNELSLIVSLFREFKYIERDISEKFSEWLLVCGKSETELEDENNPLKPSLID